MAETEKLLEGHLRAGRGWGLKAVWGGGFGKKLVGQGSCNGEGEPVPLSHPFEIQVQGHEPREEWQRGPAPGQTGSHRTGPQSSLPCLAPSHLNPPHLAQAYGSQAADPQRSGRSPTLECPISDPLQGSKQRQHPPGERPRSENPPPHHQANLPSGPAQVHTSPWQQWHSHPHNKERATGQVLPNWDDGETIWENAQP